MRLVFFGSAPFAVPTLRALSHCVTLVVSQPPKPVGRKGVLTDTAVAQVAKELGLPLATPAKCRAPEFIESLKLQHADLFVVAAYGQILPQALLDLPTRGSVNLHGSVLPKWRGAAPVQRSVEAGDTETGVTLMMMDAGLDTGDILSVTTTPIGPDETAGTVYDRLAALAATLAQTHLPQIIAGAHTRTPQDPDQATYAPKLTSDQGQVHATDQAVLAYNRFRAFTPVPGAWFNGPAGRIVLREARLTDQTAEPGSIVQTSPELVVALTNGALVLETVQPAGKTAMAGKQFANGARLTPGQRLID